MRFIGNTLILFLVVWSSCSNQKDNRASAEPQLTYLPSPAGVESSVPYLVTDPLGKVHLSWMEKDGEQHFFKFASYEGSTWSEPQLIATDSIWFVNWADYPTLLSNGKGDFISHVQSKSGKGTFDYDIKLFLRSADADQWSDGSTLNNDGIKAEHGFVSMVPYKDGVFVAWLDGRNTASEAASANHDGMHHGAMSLRAAVLGYEGTRQQEWELDKKTCDCCQTSVAITDNGPVVIYRDRSDEEIRDISIVRLVDNQWTDPVSIYKDNWKIAGCPVNGPRVFSIGNTLGIAWYTAAGDKPQVNVIFSQDGGQTFGNPVLISESNPIGRVDLVMLDDQTAVVSWMESTDIVACRVKVTGELGDRITIAQSTRSRSAGFPQMALKGNDLIFAWTDAQENQVKVAQVIF